MPDPSTEAEDEGRAKAAEQPDAKLSEPKPVLHDEITLEGWRERIRRMYRRRR